MHLKSDLIKDKRDGPWLEGHYKRGYCITNIELSRPDQDILEQIFITLPQPRIFHVRKHPTYHFIYNE